MSANYTIIIKNRSGSNNKVYNISSEAPTVDGGGVTSASNVMWYKSRALPTGNQVTFKYYSAFYAAVGYTSPFSNKLKTGDTVEQQGSIVANVGTIRDNSSVILVDKSFGITELNRTFAKSKFQILSENGLPTPNHYVVGLARQQEGEESAAPVAVVELKPNVDYTFTPKQGVYVKAQSVVDAGVVHDAPVQADIDGNKVAKVLFAAPYTTATVTEKADGTFDVEYS
jgi:hypothetical protein